MFVFLDVFNFVGNIVIGNKIRWNRNDLVFENPRNGTKLVEFSLVGRIHGKCWDNKKKVLN